MKKKRRGPYIPYHSDLQSTFLHTTVLIQNTLKSYKGYHIYSLEAIYYITLQKAFAPFPSGSEQQEPFLNRDQGTIYQQSIIAKQDHNPFYGASTKQGKLTQTDQLSILILNHTEWPLGPEIFVFA